MTPVLAEGNAVPFIELWISPILVSEMILRWKFDFPVSLGFYYVSVYTWILIFLVRAFIPCCYRFY